MLGARRSTPDARRPPLDTWCSAPAARHLVLGARRSTPGARRPPLDTWCSAPAAQRQTSDAERQKLARDRPRAEGVTMIIAAVSVKGGAGKSTLATNLACEYLRRGRRVLLVDADPQGTSRVWSEVAIENNHAPPSVVAMGRDMHRPGQLDQIAASYDVTIIDCPGRDGAVVRAALMVADLVLIPCGASPADAWALQQSLEVVEEARTLRPHMVARVVITRRRATAIGKNARGDLAASGVPLMPVELAERVAYQQAMGEGRGVTSMNAQPDAAREIRDLTNAIDNLIVETSINAVAHVA
jgi:chromosome partitioning protein